jgi:hypothetical protein
VGDQYPALFVDFKSRTPSQILSDKSVRDDLYQHHQLTFQSPNHSFFQTTTHIVPSLHLFSVDTNADIHVYGVAVVPRDATDLLKEQNARIDQVSQPDCDS